MDPGSLQRRPDRVGFSDIGGGSKAFKLVGSTYTQLNPLGGHANSIATAASATGSLIVGYSVDGSSYNQAVKWNGTTAVALDVNSDFIFSEATAVSANGSTIVGFGFTNTNSREEFLYIRNGFVFVYGNLFGTDASKATGVSDNGNVVVGTVADNFSTPSAVSGFVYSVGPGTTIVQADSAILAFANSFLTFTQLTAISGNGAVASDMRPPG